MQRATHLSLSKRKRSKDSLCSIKALPPELFLQIFMKNTELDDPLHNRLHTARHSSQVCRLWREQLLGFPSVWGRLLELAYYESVGNDWRQEVLSRARDASLWITGSVTKSTWSFFFSVLEKKWQNVEVLHITCKWDAAPGFRSAMQPILHRDAPNLASIILRDESANRGGLDEQPPSNSPSRTLFNDIAPRLHTLDILRHCYFDARVQWLSNLRSMALLPCHCSTISMILSILKLIPLLRCLKVIGNPDESPSLTEHIDLKMPLLPHLEHLELSGCPTLLTSVLEMLYSSARRPHLRSLSILTCLHRHSDIPSRILERVQRTLMKTIQCYMDDFPPQSIYLSGIPLPDSPILTIKNSYRGTASKESDPSLLIALSGSLRLFVHKLAASELPCLSNVEKLQIRTQESVEVWLPLYKALYSVTELSVDSAPSFELFDAIDQYFLFPFLRVLRWNYYGPIQSINNLYARILDFVNNRASIGAPLSFLYLPEVRVRWLSDILKSRLYGIPGLIVELVNP